MKFGCKKCKAKNHNITIDLQDGAMDFDVHGFGHYKENLDLRSISKLPQYVCKVRLIEINCGAVIARGPFKKLCSDGRLQVT